MLLGKLGVAAGEPRDGAGAGAGKVGMWIFLATDAMGFAGMWIAYGVLRARAISWPDTAERLANPARCGDDAAAAHLQLHRVAGPGSRARGARTWLRARGIGLSVL